MKTTLRQWVIGEISRDPGITIGEGRWGQKEAVFAGGTEIAHFHGPDEIDIRIDREIWKVEYPQVPPDERRATSKWRAIQMRNKVDAKLVLKILRSAAMEAKHSGTLPRGSSARRVQKSAANLR